ncbi:alpha/beta hydrolase [Asticcacaulis sp. AND118]|uniref:alpha/beta hydrolase n=1 Tax=Asticcacaulis sp. AND118 TaxID=2840468 RepID=UPI001D000C32|nr:alpha/beta hydrolase-fold protein [Asticcacaulis sp. AND118]UDF03177.1 hypothetical protein LH365_12145 [Asticcacaulis sp. AND118]
MRAFIAILAILTLTVPVGAGAAHRPDPVPAQIVRGTPDVPHGRLDKYEAFASRFVSARNVWVWVPEGYDPRGPRLPVIYMHDGQNLFETSTAYGGQEWGIDEALSAMGQKVIVVGVWNSPTRYADYFPQKLAAYLPPEMRAQVTDMAKGELKADDYLRFLVSELKPFIDRTYRTRTDAAHTSIMGSSMGGLISLYALGEYPQVFGRAACVSIHWPLMAPPTTPEAREAAADATAQAWEAWLRTAHFDPKRQRLYMDHGTRDLDSNYRPYSQKMETVLPRYGWVEGRNWRASVFEGTTHNEADWRARVDIPLGFLLAP